MFCEKYGVNTMKVAPKACCLLLLGGIVLCLAACGQKTEPGKSGADTVVATTDSSGRAPDIVAIEQQLNDVLTRLRYGDKSGLYENEFDYFTDETTFDKYLEMGQIRWANADTLAFLEVRDIEYFDHDSALVKVTVHFENATGHKSFLDDKIILYYHNGRWIKPTVTVIDLQVDYEEKIRVADSAAAAEAAEEGND